MPKSKNQRGEASGLAAILRDAANRSGQSVYQIAKESGVDQSTLNKFLKGDRDNLRLDVADRLFNFFRLKVIGQAQMMPQSERKAKKKQPIRRPLRGHSLSAARG